eukprot:522831-Prorocentrum_minimum.AAC.1
MSSPPARGPLVADSFRSFGVQFDPRPLRDSTPSSPPHLAGARGGGPRLGQAPWSSLGAQGPAANTREGVRRGSGG